MINTMIHFQKYLGWLSLLLCSIKNHYHNPSWHTLRNLLVDFYCSRIQFDYIALNRFLKLSTQKFISVVVINMMRMCVTAYPFFVKNMCCFSRWSWCDTLNFHPGSTSINNHENVDMWFWHWVSVWMILSKFQQNPHAYDTMVLLVLI